MDYTTLAQKVMSVMFDAGKLIRSAWHDHSFIVSKKDAVDVVTETDVIVENFLREKLSVLLPEAGFIVEEGATAEAKEYNWTIDPIDGTKYFAKSTPLFFTQVALLNASKEPVLSFVYNPISEQMFHAIKGVGSFVDSTRVILEKGPLLKNSIAHFDMGSLMGDTNSWKFDLFRHIAERTYRVRFTAGFLVPYMLSGAIHLTINTDVKTPFSVKNITDLAPHKLLLLEAGYLEKVLKFGEKNVLYWGFSNVLNELVHTLQSSSRL